MKPAARVFLWIGVAIAIVLAIAFSVRKFREATFYPGVVQEDEFRGALNS